MPIVELLLVTSVAALVATTLLLCLFGRAASTARRTKIGAALVCVAAVLLLVGPLGPAAVIPGAVGAVALLLPRHWHLTGSLFFASLLVTFGVYALYLVRATFLLGGEPIGVVLGAVLLAFEMAALTLLATSAFEMVDALAAEPPRLPDAQAPDRWPLVCLQVPAYNEPPDLVIETVRSLVALDYPALRVQVIDNNTEDEALWRPVAAECERLSAEGHDVEFAHLPSWPGYKAGALNWGLAQLADDVEIIGVVDADYVVDPAWLRATIPYFSDPAVAFVQTPQDYRAWEESAFYRACYAGFAMFFKMGMLSRSRRNAIIFAGTMGLVRRDALQRVGGWDERIITEDAELSLRLLRDGGRAVYVPVAFGRGIMPLTYEGLRKQRFRWAFGGIQILRRHWRSIAPWSRRSGLTFAQRYDHLMGGLWWFNDALTLGFSAFVFAAALGVLLDRPFVVQRLTGVGIVLPLAFVILNLGRYAWATRVATGAGAGLALSALRVNLSLSWVIALACLRGLTQERGVFLRTPKFQGAPAIRELRLVWAETAIAGLALALLIGVIVAAGGSLVGLGLAGLLGWSLLIYGSATSYALADPTRAPLTAALRQKALLELRPRLGRAARARTTRVGIAGSLAMLFVMMAVAIESGRAPVSELPFPDSVQPLMGLGGAARPEDTPGLPSPNAEEGAAPPGAFPATSQEAGIAPPDNEPATPGGPLPAASPPAPAEPGPPAQADGPPQSTDPPTPAPAGPPAEPPAPQPQPTPVIPPAGEAAASNPAARPSEQPTPPVSPPGGAPSLP